MRSGSTPDHAAARPPDAVVDACCEAGLGRLAAACLVASRDWASTAMLFDGQAADQAAEQAAEQAADQAPPAAPATAGGFAWGARRGAGSSPSARRDDTVAAPTVGRPRRRRQTPWPMTGPASSSAPDAMDRDAAAPDAMGRSASTPAASRPPTQEAALGPRLLVVAALVWVDDATVVVQRRPPFGAHARELELPGGKVERGEAPRAALLRELVEEWGEHARMLNIADVCDVLHHVYPGDEHRGPGPEVVLLVYHVDGRAFAPEASAWIRPAEGVELLQCEVSQLPVAEFVAADREFVAAIRDRRVRPPVFT